MFIGIEKDITLVFNQFKGKINLTLLNIIELIMLGFLFIFNDKVFYFLLLWFLGLTYNNLMNQTNLISSFRFLPGLIVLLTVLVRLFVKCLTVNKETILFSRLITLFSILFFLSNNLFTFYLFFEIRIIPILFLILGFGYQTERIQAATYLLIYTILCSFPFIFLIFKILQTNWTLYLFQKKS